MSWRLYQQLTEPIQVTTTPEVVTADKWYQPFLDPRRLAGISAALIAASGAVISPWALTQAEAVTESRWHQPLSEPVRVNPALSAALQQSATYVPVFITPEIITLDKWYAPFREPVRAKPSLLAGANKDLFLGTPPIVPNIPPPLSEPVRSRMLIAAHQQHLAFVKATPFPEAVSVASWFKPFEIPARLRRQTDSPATILAPVQPSTSASAILYLPLSEPVWTRSRLSALSPEQFYFRFIDNPAPSMASWNFEWVTPVRFLVGHTPLAAQQGTVMPIIPIPTPSVTGVYTVSGLYVIDQFTDNTVVYDYSGGVSHRTN